MSPSFESIIDVLEDLNKYPCPQWLTEKLSKFKRNFHIFEQTGLFLRYSQGLKLASQTTDSLDLIKAIAEMDSFFSEFNSSTNKKELENVIGKYSWGRYYDSAARLSLSTLAKIVEPNAMSHSNEFIREVRSVRFPSLASYDNTVPNSIKYSAIQRSADPEITRLKREKANRDHARMVNMIANLARLSGAAPSENVFIDLFVEMYDIKYIFEMKSCNSNNVLSQIRKGISQLYEYRFRCNATDAILCLVLQSKPDEWLLDYLVHDRGIHCFWLIDEITFDCLQDSRNVLAPFIS